ncbi:TetR family transcriptional regulator [Staphylococcus simiae]|uniref:ica operon transcriptional regulator IcaR n=1 Tax=Staphylococcus simiae TaxID=308354 RepID=UPI001A9785FA|nr:ica operon transcriptional regulator IcaR [Staphylococcus simiae]MBO1199029.1 TetR family transcriptional regulator [Staphylococcus simiae]MBO1201297.1 TetR family transcriptional regulator [Staphylococcus simiae]MBO1203459.1 TetR family transcriptional regulator [Staphylococcus simiae]MBO1210987.1 TetR family transcriptional regulator [Staphylococcus simiae]MBO1229635.1 TetR family transcriptional regulator [Staphylococcus simiae]
MKDKIIDNAITLFSEKGYDGTTLDDIAKSVNIRKASVYYHFGSKKDIYERSVECCFDYLANTILINQNKSNYSIDALYQFLFEFIFDVEERYIRMYVQLSNTPEEFSEDIYNQIQSLNSKLSDEVSRFYDETKMTMSEEDFKNLILLFLESCYLKASFSQKFGEVEESKNRFKDEVYSLLNIFLKK